MKTNTAASTLLRSCTRFAPLALTVALAAVLAACGGGGSTTTSATPTATTPATTPTTTPGTTTAVVTPVATPTPVVVAPVVGNLATSVPTPTYAAGSKELAMFTQLNDVRLKGGFGMLAQDAAVDKAAANHANYILSNYLTATSNGAPWLDFAGLLTVDPVTGVLNGHVEKVTGVGFTGILPIDRLKATGGSNTVYAGEVVAFTEDFCVDTLLNSVFHRNGLLNTATRTVGMAVIAQKNVNVNAACVINTAYTTAQIRPAGWMGVYPGVGQTGVALAMGNEAPDPAPEIPNAQKGSPVSIYLNGPLTTVNAFTLTAAGSSTPVPVKVLTYALFPAYLTKNEAHILPTQNLAPATTYTVNFAGQMADGSIASKSWTFTTK